MAKTYLKFIGYMQIIAILLVVIGHSFHEYPDGMNGSSMLAYRMIYSFHMPLFIFISGFLLAYTFELKKSSPAAFVSAKVKRLLIPFFVLTLVTFVPRVGLSAMADDAITLSWSSFIDSFILSDRLVIPYFWFIQSIFIMLVVCFFYLLLIERIHISQAFADIILIIIATLLMQCNGLPGLFSLNKTANMLIYFTLGIACAHFYPRIDKLVKWSSFSFLISCITIWAFLFFTTEYTAFFPLCSLAGIMMTISMSKIIVSSGTELFDHMLGANYIIFLLSWYFNTLAQQVLSHFITMPWWIYTVMSIMFGIYIPWSIYRMMLRHPDTKTVRLLSLLLGQTLKH